MVFHSIAEEAQGRLREQSEDQNSNGPEMASSSALKSHPLHNFSLPDLKWGMNQTNNHRFRKQADSSKKSPLREGDADSDSRRGNPPAKSGVAGSNSSSDHKTEKSEKKMTSEGCDLPVEKAAKKSEKKATGEASGLPFEKAVKKQADARSKIFIRFKGKNNSKSGDDVAEEADPSLNAEEAEEFMPKTWNLRPRKPIKKAPNPNGGTPKAGGAAVPENKSHRPDAKAAEKKEKEKKQKFSVSLSREEIEDDIFAMTGAKPSRRPKKRAKNVQKQLDSVFPGLWLASVTPDVYKVDVPLKG